MKTFQDRLKAQDEKYRETVEYYKKWFRENDEIKTDMGITFIRKESHNEQLGKNEALRNAGFKITSTSPEYDGMVRWYISLTEDVQL